VAQQPGLPTGARSSFPRPDYIIRRIQDLERTVAEQASTLARVTGMSFVNGAISSKTFDGDLAAPAAGTSGFALGGPHDTLIVNDLVLRGQIIGDDALTDPVSPGIYDNTTNSRGASGTLFTYIDGSIAVPTGYSKALVMATGITGATSNGTGGFYVETVIQIAGVDGSNPSQWTDTGTASSCPASQAAVVTGLSGGSLSVRLRGLQTTPANVLAASVQGALSAVALFLR
jgi:hypothetical protein